MHWGGWNACPKPEYHVAAFRYWRDKYGVELVGMSRDVLNLKVARRPASRGEAIGLAQEQYAYCSDLIAEDQMTYSYLAALLMQSGWWFFWWD